jgi:hypothetical protein
MEKENEGVQDVDLELEEETTEEEEEQQEEQVVTIPKDKFVKMQRKAMAFDATKNKPLPTKSVDEEIISSVKKLEVIEAKRQFGYENSLSPEETDFLFKFTGGKPDKSVLENPFVKSGIEGFRASKRVEANTPGSSSRSQVFQGKEFKEMSDDERRKSFEASAKARGFV